MKVRAKELGYYDEKRRRPGEVFELEEREGFTRNENSGKATKKVWSAEEQFSEKWMEKVDADDAVDEVDGEEEEPHPRKKLKKKAKHHKAVESEESPSEDVL